MNKQFILILLGFTAICSTRLTADNIDSALNQLAQGEEVLCAKGDILSLKFSIRSYKGTQCKDLKVAALAEMICPVKNIDNYNQSACHGYAQEALQGRSPLLVLIDEMKKDGRKYERLVCAGAKLSSRAADACRMLKLANIYLPYLR